MDDSFSAAERVRVIVRVRPQNEREQQQEASAPSCHHILQIDDAAGKIYVCKKKKDGESSDADRELRCSYDRVFGSTATQQDVFAYLQDSVQQVAQGFNCTIFAYGQTGTGKTHTMLGKDVERHIESLGSSPSSASNSSSNGNATSRDGWGVIPRAIESLFDELRSIGRHGAAGIVYCSYMQIYNNDVYDLLQENRQRMKDPLAVREMIKGNGKQIYVSGLSEFRVTNVDETLKLLKTGNRNRTIRATEYNEKSSRSHALLQLSAEVESRGVEGATTIIRRAKLNLVDLAGSEKWATDVAMGTDRCRELTAINQSLSALGNVISALTNAKRSHIPYRDSKLTRLLCDSLGGNTRTVVVATISPSETSLDETISTLQFADRAKCVMLRVKVNEMVDDAVLLARAQREIARLQVLLKQNASQQRVAELEDHVAKLTRENAALLLENKRLRKRPTEVVAAAAGASLPTSVSDDDTATQSPLRSGAKRPNRQLAGATTIGSSSGLYNSESAAHGGSKRTSKEKSASSLAQLRLDLVGQASASDAAAGGRKPKAIAAFVDNDDDALHAQIVSAAEREHEQLLHAIQTERRTLEQQLEQLSLSTNADSTDTNALARKHEPATSDSNNDNGDNGDVCPMCGCNIDDHSDAALDVCIEREERAVEAQQRAALASASSSGSSGAVLGADASPRDCRIESNAQAQGPQVAAIPLARADRDASDGGGGGATITPRRASTSAGGGARPSPYAQELALKKPSTPSSQLKSKPFAKQRSLREDGVNDGVNERSTVGATINSNSNSSVHQAMKSTAVGAAEAVAGHASSDDANVTASNHSSERSNNQLDAPPPEIPILRQGHKGVKALKKFHAASPYNLKLLKRTAADRKSVSGATSSGGGTGSATGVSSDVPRKQRSEENPNCPTTDANAIAVTNSMRDIGLKLTVYKFRYDCWYPCTVVGYDGKRKLHCCQFEFGDKQWLDMKERKIQVVGRIGLDGDE